MKKIFITGASSGLGAALAMEFANETIILGLLSRRVEAVQQVSKEFTGKVYCYGADVGDPVKVRNAAESFMESVGVPDIVIANAGISAGTDTSLVEDQGVFERIMRTNVLGMVHTFQPFLSAMSQRGSGSLVGISSIAGFRGIPGSGAYSASKAAATSYLESLRVELSLSGINVLTVCPGYIRTPMTDVNHFYMPFLINAESAAASIIKAINKKKRFHVVPWQMAVIGFLLRLLPRALYDFLFRRAPRKPRV